MKLLILILLSLPLFSKEINPNDINEKIFSCALDPDVTELYFYSNQQEPTVGLEILENIESIRPNCIDIQQSKLLFYEMNNNMRKFRYTELKIKELKMLKQRIYGFEEPYSYSMPISKKEIIKQEPPKKDKINYWKWLFIYSILRK